MSYEGPDGAKKWELEIAYFVPGKGRLTANSVIAETALAEKLQTSFTEPWRDLNATNIPQLDYIETLPKVHSPSLPSIGQIRCALDHLNQSKATGANGAPAWLLKRFSSVLAPTVHQSLTLLWLALKVQISKLL